MDIVPCFVDEISVDFISWVSIPRRFRAGMLILGLTAYQRHGGMSEGFEQEIEQV